MFCISDNSRLLIVICFHLVFLLGGSCCCCVYTLRYAVIVVVVVAFVRSCFFFILFYTFISLNALQLSLRLICVSRLARFSVHACVSISIFRWNVFWCRFTIQFTRLSLFICVFQIMSRNFFRSRTSTEDTAAERLRYNTKHIYIFRIVYVALYLYLSLLYTLLCMLFCRSFTLSVPFGECAVFRQLWFLNFWCYVCSSQSFTTINIYLYSRILRSICVRVK